MKVAKYKLAAFFSAHTNQPLPEAPFTVSDCPKQLFGGAAGKWLKLNIKRQDGITLMEFLTSILQSKKGMPRAGKADLKNAERDTIKKLTTWTKAAKALGLVDWNEMDASHPKVELTLSQLTWEMQLRRTVRELFHEEKFTAAQRVKAFFPSTSANYIRSRKNAGALGEIIEHPTLLNGLRVPGGHVKTVFREREPTRFKLETKSGRVRVVKGSWEEEMEEEGRIYTPTDQREFDKAFETLWLRVLKLASTENMFAEPVGLAEALKNRVITKGPPFVQTVLRALWKKMHSTLRKHRAFRLIGEPISVQYMTEILGTKLPEGKAYLSGDYADATNGLKSFASKIIADEIGNQLNLHKVERRLLEASLTGHLIVEKREDGGTIIREQLTGQLMGSITSFPILCIANAAGTRWAMEIDENKPILLRDLKAGFNGDDVAAVTGPKGYEMWRKILGFIGLTESVGKTYYSKEFVNMNSTNFLAGQESTYQDSESGKIRKTPFIRTNYINMGLLTGKKRSEASVSLNDEDNPYERIGVAYRDLIKNSPANLKLAVHKAFIEHHKDVLEKSRVPWYIPEWLGGLGMTGVEKPSETDLRIARRILLNWTVERPIQLGRKEAKWKTWQLASKLVPTPNYTPYGDDPGVDQYKDLVAKKCVDLLFDSNVNLEDLLTTSATSRTNQALAHNSHLWSPRSRGPKCPCRGLPDPIDPKEIEYQSKYETYSPTPTPPSKALHQTLYTSLD